MENDYELLYLYRENPEFIGNILLKKYYNLINYKASKYSKTNMEYDDFLNEAILTLYYAMENYRDSSNFNNYLTKCLDNSLFNYRKSLERDKYKILNETVSIEEVCASSLSISNGNRDNPENIIIDEDNYKELKRAILKSLTWKEELIFTLKEQDYTPKEISEITDSNLKTVYNIIRRIQNKVSNIMSNNCLNT